MLFRVLYVQFPLLQQQPEARERTWVVQRAVVRHPAQHGHVGGHSAHKTAQSPGKDATGDYLGLRRIAFPRRAPLIHPIPRNPR